MKDEYDFSQAEVGKFYREGAKLHLPVYLEDDVMTYLEQHARAKGVDVSELANDLLRRDIALVEAVK